MTPFLIILLCPTAGYLLRKAGKVPDGAAAGVNAWVLNVALPALALLYIPRVSWSAGSLVPLAMPLVVWAGAWAIVRLFGARWGLDPGERTALVLTAGLGNTSFVGFPLLTAYYGEGALPTGILCDQATFLLLSTVGMAVALRFQAGTADRGKTVSWGPMARKVLTFPPFLACVAGVLLPRFLDLSPAQPLLTALGGTLAPLALFSVGLQLRFGGLGTRLRPLAAGLAYKLLLAPALVLALVWLSGTRGLGAQVPVFEAAMAPMITAAVVASDHGAAPRLANAMVGIGIPLSLGVSALWWALGGLLL